jgi:ABC-2 type transport system ATP-binding protein
MALIAEDLVVIGQGRLLEQCPVDDFVARYAEHWVRFRSPSGGAVAGAAESAGIEVQRIDGRTLELRGVTCERVGEIAAAQQAVVHELSPQSGSLEDAFLRATARVQEYSAQPLPGTALPRAGSFPPPALGGEG